MEVVSKNWDFNAHVHDVVAFAKKSKNSFPFFFIDPTGSTEAQIDRIRPILKVDPGEVLINLMSSWIKRFLDDPRKPFGKLLGDRLDWLRTLEGDEQEDELVNCYAGLVRGEGGYLYTCAMPILMPDRDAIHYHLVYGTRHFKGLEEFKRTEADAIPYMHQLRAASQRRRQEEASGQPFLLPASDTYYKPRFDRFHARRLANARSAVIDLLTRRKSVEYRILYEESMQYATVDERDLRQWLDEWENNNLIQYENWSKAQRVPRPETIITRLKPLA
jgi:hypothetical protein